MNQELHDLMLKNGLRMAQVAPSDSTNEEIEFVAECCLGCDWKRTGRFSIPRDADVGHPAVRKALRHLKWCRNAQQRKRLSNRIPKRQQAAQEKRLDREIIWRSACDVLREFGTAPVKQQVAEFKQICDHLGVQNVTENTFKRIKYRIRSTPF
jgi:hypothetical protein